MKRLIGLTCFLAWSSAHAAELTPRTYTEADVEVREVTMEGMRERFELLSAGATDDELFDAGSQNAALIEEIYSEYGTSGGAHAAYGSRERAAIDAWLAEQPDWQQHYQSLERDFEALRKSLETLQGAQ